LGKEREKGVDDQATVYQAVLVGFFGVAGNQRRFPRRPFPLLRSFPFPRRTNLQGCSGKDDRLRPENVAAVNICFGAWLFPQHASEQHIVEIEEIALVKATRTHSGDF
jgi:hypothetical protein